MKVDKKQELIDIWNGLNLLGPYLDEKNLGVVIRGYELYKEEIILMANLCRISKYLKSKYSKISGFIIENRENEEKIIDLIENIIDNKVIYFKKDITSLADYATIFTTAIRYLEIEETRKEHYEREEKIRIYKCQRDDGDER